MEKYKYSDHDYGLFNWCLWEHPANISDLRIAEAVPRQMKALSRFIKAGDVTIDVGAYTGDTALPMALLAGKTGLCLAIEPNPHSYVALSRNAFLNSDKCNIVPFNYAVGMPGDEITFNYSDPGFCNGGLSLTPRKYKCVHPCELQVKCISLGEIVQNINPKKVAFIKTDTEGNDFAVLFSIRDFLREVNGVVLAEIFVDMNREEREQLMDFMFNLGFKLFDAAHSKELTKEEVFAYWHGDVMFARE